MTTATSNAGSESETVKSTTAERNEPADPRCRAALRDVEAAGLALPDLFEYRCPGDARLFPGDTQHWGSTCAYASLCPDGAYVAVNPTAIGASEARMRYVVAHEICHALDFLAHRPVSEAGADSCAAAHRFPRV